MVDALHLLIDELKGKYMPKVGFVVVATVFSGLLTIGAALGGMMMSDIKHSSEEFSNFKVEASETHTIHGKDIESNARDIKSTEQDIEDINYKIDQVLDILRNG